MEISPFISVSLCPYDKFVIHYQRRHVFHDVVDHLGSENRNGVTGKLFISFRRQYQPLRRDLRYRIEIFVLESLYSFAYHISSPTNPSSRRPVLYGLCQPYLSAASKKLQSNMLLCS